MTSLLDTTDKKECVECTYFGTCCFNTESDHYGHVLDDCHPVCVEFSPEIESEEDQLCIKCRQEYVDEGEDLCLNCK